MKKIGAALLAMVLFGFIGCSTKEPINSNIGNKINLTVEPGIYWMGKKKIFIFSADRTPQMAAWLEDDYGNYISTITVTNRGAKKNWRSSPKEGRPEALPVWNHKMQNTSANENMDAVSTATPKGHIEAQINDSLLIIGQEYNVYLEINHSFDYNETWTENETGVNGQPSLIYYANFIMGQANKINLAPIGYGSVDGSNGNITTGISGLTTALGIIKNAYVTIPN